MARDSEQFASAIQHRFNEALTALSRLDDATSAAHRAGVADEVGALLYEGNRLLEALDPDQLDQLRENAATAAQDLKDMIPMVTGIYLSKS